MYLMDWNVIVLAANDSQGGIVEYNRLMIMVYLLN